MISSQVIQKTLDELRSITRIDLCVMDVDGKVNSTTFPIEDEDFGDISSFVESMADSQVIRGYHFFKIYDGQTVEFILIAKGGNEDTYMIGRVAVAEIQNLIVAYKERFDKSNFIQNLILDNLLLVDVYNRAKKLHIPVEAKRVVILVEIRNEKDQDAIEILKNMFISRSNDFITAIDEKNIIIDSKMSLNAYESAVNSEDEFERERLLREHIKALKNHIDDLHRKDYSNLIGMRSPNFVLMFIAVEPAYIEALKLDPSLFNYGYEKNVIMVSHTTLMPILRTVANLWRIERGNAEAKEIAEKAGEIYNQICLVAERLNKLGNTLSTVSNQYNSTVTALVGQQGLVGKVERFKDLSAKANKSMPNVELLNNDVDLTRLSLITTENEVK